MLIILLPISISSVAYTGGGISNAGTTDYDLEKSYSMNSYREKMYMQTDKPYYSSGEQIWFKAYLVNATTHHTDIQSEYIYVELADKSDSVFSCIKIKKDSVGFNGHIKLKPGLTAARILCLNQKNII